MPKEKIWDRAKFHVDFDSEYDHIARKDEVSALAFPHDLGWLGVSNIFRTLLEHIPKVNCRRQAASVYKDDALAGDGLDLGPAGPKNR